MLRRILAPLDGSDRAECALPHAAALARTFGAELYLLRVVEGQHAESPGVVDSLAWRVAQAAAGAYLDDVASRLTRLGLDVRAHIAEGRVAEEIVQFAQRHEAELVVLSTHGSGEAIGFTIGGTARKVVERVGISILLVPSHDVEPALPTLAIYRRILAPLDCSKRSEWAATVGAQIARAQSAELVLAHVVAVPSVTIVDASPGASHHATGLLETNREAAMQYLEHLAQRLVDRRQRVRTRLEVHERPAQALAHMIADEQPDLVVLSAHGTSADVQQGYGSVCSTLLAPRHAAVLVLQDMSRVTPPDGMEALAEFARG